MKRVVAVLAVCLGAGIALAGMPAEQLQKLQPGDVNMDGTVDNFDVLAILDWQDGIAVLSNQQLRLGDVDNNGVVDTADAALLLGQVASQGWEIRRIEMTVDPAVGVVESTMRDPLQSIKDRQALKAHEENPSAFGLDYQGGYCSDCTGTPCDVRTVIAQFVWTMDAYDMMWCGVDVDGEDAAPYIQDDGGTTSPIFGGSAIGFDWTEFVCADVFDCTSGGCSPITENGEEFDVITPINLDGTCDRFIVRYDLMIWVDQNK